MSLFAGDLGNAIWTLLIFLLVVLVLGKFAWGPILKTLHKREQFIRESLVNAKREREDAKKLMAEYAAKMDASRAEASAIVEEGRRDAEELRKKLSADAKAEADSMIARAKRDIQIARDTAIAELYDRTLDLAANVAGKIVHKQLTPSDHKALLDESLAQMSKTSNN